MIELDWYKCYGESWTNEIIPEAFSHPAKFSRALIKRIYEHCIERGRLTEGSVIVDPFGGVALGGFHALQHGMHWLGVELEPRFVRLGGGYDCPGFSQADWMIRQQMSEEDQKNFAIHLCPICQKTITGEGVLGLLLEQAPHHFEGNIDLWNRRYGGHFRKWGTAKLIQGDSRKLREVIGGLADGICTSPPYADQTVKDAQRYMCGKTDKHWDDMTADQQAKIGYGAQAGQLGHMPPGDADGVITSSPYTNTVGSDDPDKRGGLYKDPKRREDVNLTATYGNSEGQLAGMVEGDVILTSPPYIDSLEKPSGIDPTKSKHTGGPHSQMNASNLRYGEENGQLAAMPAGEADGLVTSPPWESTNLTTDEKFMAQVEQDQRAGSRLQPGLGEYGDTPGQIGTQSGDTFWSAARIIVAECFEILKPGSVAVFVTKRFVRDKKIVQFSDQWRQLCESCGFELVEWVKAWLIEDRGIQYDLWGGKEKREIKRMSFFRRLHASKYPHLSIDWEDVLIFKKRDLT